MSPASEYVERLSARRRTYSRLLILDERLSHARLAVFAAGGLVAWLAFGTNAAPAAALLIPAAAFILLMRRHARVIAARDAAARAIVFYERGVARLEDRWAGLGEPGDRFRNDDHLYANDLDVFGRGSLFELLSIARTRAGEETLATWLMEPATREEILQRQRAVDELTPKLDLREELALAGVDVRASVDTERLVAWAAAPPVLLAEWPWAVAGVLTASAIGTAVLWAAGGPSQPFFAVVAVEVLFSLPLRRSVVRVLHAAERPSDDLDVLAHVLARIERDEFQSPALAAVRAALSDNGGTASEAIRALHRLAEAHDWQHNQFFGPISAALLWGTHLAFAMERWRRRHGGSVAGWLEAVGRVEAFSSLSAYRYEHPDDVFPEILAEGGATLEGTSLGHPLLPAARMVRNDVHLAGDTRMLVVSGSNMSGKSTLLRTVGINAVLALAGAPVRAGRLRLTPLAVGATLRIQDSLQEGKSRFYAEITRLRRLADEAKGPKPLLFLLDELFHGTNSHDRLLGAIGVLRSFLDRGAIGLITTHDLALTDVEKDLAPRAVNVHFEDRFEGSDIVFDYRMRPGPVTRSNALALMRAVGLDVPPQSERAP